VKRAGEFCAGRGVDEGALVEGARRSSFDELADWTLWADKVVSF
jgi:uncharacterized protein involved in oxidation of intracellular sulfur